MNTTHSLERIFHYHGKPFRTLQEEGNGPWFVAADVCGALGLSQVSRAVKRLDVDTVRLLKVTHPQQVARSVAMNAVNEAGLYHLILSSNKPAAKSFRRWITNEVIPELRQTGRYQMEPASRDFGWLPSFTRRDLLKLAIEAEDECEELRQANAAMLPKAEAYERLTDTTDTFSLGEAAKLLGIPEHGRNNLIKFLRSDGVLMTNNIARQRFIDRGYFHIVQQEYFAPGGAPHVRAVTRVYASGVEFIRQRMQNYIMRELAKPENQ